MKKGPVYIVSLFVAFTAGFTLCYILLMGDPEIHRARRGHNQVALVNVKKSAIPPLISKPAPKLEWKPYVIHPTLPPRIVELHEFRPNGKTLQTP